MVESAIEHKNPKVDGGSIVTLELRPADGEELKDFNSRLDSFIHGVHQMEFKKLGPSQWRLSVELNPSWAEPEEFDPSKISQDDLVEEFRQTQAGTHNNKLKYGGE